MRLSFSSAVLAACVPYLVSAAVLPEPSLAPALPLNLFNNTIVKPLTLEEALSFKKTEQPAPKTFATNIGILATCANPRVRIEWDSYSTADRTAFVNAIKCLMGRPASGAFGQSRSRYEDFVALHQSLTPNVHGNAKFLIWHRYYLWTFEDVLRTECGFNRPIPWFDETKYAGRFSQSSVFSNEWFGAVGIGGNCVTNGQFANLRLNVGPGSGNTPHCLARNGDASKTANTNSAMVNACNSRTTYADMAGCSEGGAHAWGHNGIGAVMSDAYASPGDPVFFLHHAFIDRNFRIWQNASPSRQTTIGGTDRVGNPLTLDTSVSVNGIRPNVVIRDILDTTSEKLCYKYNY